VDEFTSTVLYDVTLCSLIDVLEERTPSSSVSKQQVDCLFGVLFYPEDGGSTWRNIPEDGRPYYLILHEFAVLLSGRMTDD
jgi:hypothetical protein